MQYYHFQSNKNLNNLTDNIIIASIRLMKQFISFLLSSMLHKYPNKLSIADSISDCLQL